MIRYVSVVDAHKQRREFMSNVKHSNKLIVHHDPKSSVAEAYRTMRTNIQFSSIDKELSTIMVASANPGEGKTLTVSNLAATYAQEGKKVVVMDGDMRKPTLHKMFQISNTSGLTSILTNQNTLESQLCATFIEGLDVIPSGPVPPNPSELLASKKMAELMGELKEKYDLILIDSPPVMAVTDAQVIAASVDGVVFIVKSGTTKREVLRKAKGRLEHVKAHILGVVLNDHKHHQQDYYEYSYE